MSHREACESGFHKCLGRSTAKCSFLRTLPEHDDDGSDRHEGDSSEVATDDASDEHVPCDEMILELSSPESEDKLWGAGTSEANRDTSSDGDDMAEVWDERLLICMCAELEMKWKKV